MNALTPVLHYQSMACEESQPQIDDGAVLLMAGYMYRGIAFDLHGWADIDDGCTIRSVCIAGSTVDLYPLIEGRTLETMATTCDHVALKERDESRAENILAGREVTA
jgi:hypothetical protein